MVSPNRKLITPSCLLFKIFLITSLIILLLKDVQATPEDDAIRKWAQNFGAELLDLGRKMTKSPEIKAKYKEYNARVEQKDGDLLLKSIMKNVGRMLARKMDAIRCIQKKAEEAAEHFDYNETYALNEFAYYSSKYSNADEIPESLEDNVYMYLNMTLNQDTHFYNISVNTNYSSVHVPSNIYDKSSEVLKAIIWSEELDEVFRQNYKSDPALSWQYFGSDTGILRHYPALRWETGDETDIYDCRKRSWYIETATCSKDVVILLDNSGSMFGFRHHVAKFTIRSILDTFSNNDFFTIYSYSKEVVDLIECFQGVLVQATPENIIKFNEAVADLVPEGYANVNKALIKAFELLKKYYMQRRCGETKTGCNQAIMLVTDGVPGNYTDIFERYNWGIGENSTKMGVRVFTYLLGKEVTKVHEIQSMACDNRGYYSHVRTLDEVHEEVLKYVDVIATPLVLQNELHPPTWTHAFTDKAYQQEDEHLPPRLMIAVGVPAFDRTYLWANSTKRARLLGVAGTDVPVADIDKLTLPYKLGVNAYPFVVSNNGYVLLHPDLRPMENGQLKDNYNSIDLTEVEQFNDANPPRQPSKLLLQLREALVNHSIGKMENISIKFHYDNMRRVSVENQTYFYGPLPNTPFSLGLVVPSGYGSSWIKVGDQLEQNLFLKINISNYFVGQNWKVHPDWVYCKYHYLEGHEFQTPEEELRHFLVKMSSPGWKWQEQYETDFTSDNTSDEKPNCGRQTLDDNAYYCNDELVQLLLFDAKVTNTSYGTWKFANKAEKDLIESYNATLRFVATMSGLTRWQFIFGEDEVEGDQEFGDYHKLAIDETWYRSTILQHAIDPESFVYSIPHPDDAIQDEPLMVTASHAIFPRDGGKEAPGSVVGFQFSHTLMWKRFENITSVEDCGGCVLPCRDYLRDCYVIDNNGYVILSEEENDTGKFFGDVNAAVMQEMVDQEIFKQITVYDLQAVCTEVVTANDGSLLTNPIRFLGFLINWLVTELIWLWGRFNLFVASAPYDYEDDDEAHYHPPTPPSIPMEQDPTQSRKNKTEVITTPCDKKINLFVLNQEMFISGNDYNAEVPTKCSEPFHVKLIPQSNLLLVVVKAITKKCYTFLTTAPQVITYEQEFPCYKLNLSFLGRRRLEECFTKHENESLYTYCGDATTIRLELPLLIISAIILFTLGYSN